MSEAVVDTSVVFKWFGAHDEAGTDEALGLLDAHAAGTRVLIAPASMPLELANSLRYSGMAVDAVLEIVGGVGLTHIESFELSSERLERATDLALEHDISVYDAVFLALAHERGCPLVTADRKAFAGIETTVAVELL